MSTLYRRLEYLSGFLLVVFSVLIVAVAGNTIFSGVMIIIVAFARLAIRPGRNELLYRLQAERYRALITDCDEPEYGDIERYDNFSIGLLRNAAYKRALIATGYSQEADAVQLTIMEKIAACFAGDLPEVRACIGSPDR